MRVNSFIGQSGGIFRNAQAVNANLMHQKGTSQSEQSRKDRVFLSIGGKSSPAHVIENLQKQRQALVEKKSEIRAKALQDGQSAQQVDALTETYDMQIKNIDMQIARIQSEQAENKTDKKEQETKPKTQQQAQREQIYSLSEMANYAEQTDVMYGVKKEIDGQVRTLKSEIELDKSRGVGKDIIERKQKEVTKMEIRSNEIMDNVSQKLGEVNEAAQENTVSTQQKESENNAKTFNPQKESENDTEPLEQKKDEKEEKKA